MEITKLKYPKCQSCDDLLSEYTIRISQHIMIKLCSTCFAKLRDEIDNQIFLESGGRE